MGTRSWLQFHRYCIQRVLAVAVMKVLRADGLILAGDALPSWQLLRPNRVPTPDSIS